MEGKFKKAEHLKTVWGSRVLHWEFERAGWAGETEAWTAGQVGVVSNSRCGLDRKGARDKFNNCAKLIFSNTFETIT